MIYATIALLRMAGLATDVVTPDQYEKPAKAAAGRAHGPLAPDFDPDHDDLKISGDDRIDAGHGFRMPSPHLHDQDSRPISSETVHSQNEES